MYGGDGEFTIRIVGGFELVVSFSVTGHQDWPHKEIRNPESVELRYYNSERGRWISLAILGELSKDFRNLLIQYYGTPIHDVPVTLVDVFSGAEFNKG